MTEIAMRVARVMGKKNITRSIVSLEEVAKVVDDIAQIPLLLNGFSNMNAVELIDIITLAAAKEVGTF